MYLQKEHSNQEVSANATITGNISYPSSCSPAQTVCAVNTKDSTRFCTPQPVKGGCVGEEGTDLSFSFVVPAGTYYVFATKDSAQGYYTDKNGVKIPVTVAVGGTASVYPNAPLPDNSLSVSPISGSAPLTVTFSNFPSTAAEEDLSFGDGAEASNGLKGWPASGQVSHTYTNPGTYTATLEGSMSNGQLGQFTITVTGSAQPASPLSATPLSGAPPLTVQFTVSNLKWPGPFALDFGDGTIDYSLADYCSTTASSCLLSHTYTSAGSYTAKFYLGKINESDGPTATVGITAGS